jgi:hypothetical protein
MKKLFSACCIMAVAMTTLAFAADDAGLSAAQKLAAEGIIVDQSTSVAADASLGANATGRFRLNDPISRQEAVGIILKLAKVTLDENYGCRNYFSDVREAWVCRAVELAADHDIVSRVNARFRPRDTLTLAESLGLLVKGLNIRFSNTATSNITADLPDWQKRLILTLNEGGIGSFKMVGWEYEYYVSSDVSFALSDRVTRGDFFRVAALFLELQDPLAHCTTYNDGCNECSTGDEGPICTERMCIWQGIPQCHTCEEGYELSGNRCVRRESHSTTCIGLGEYAGGGEVMYPENPDDFQCCARDGLIKAERADGSTFADAGYTCINEGDKICDPLFESELNSADCRAIFNPSICKTYYDGCNSCVNTENGAACTKKACFVNGPAYCTEYVEYKPVDQGTYATFLGKVTNEITNYVKDVSCTTDSDCKSVGLGVKGCGGPISYLPYSTITIDEKLLQTKAEYLVNAYKTYNTKYEIMSDCMLTIPKDLKCVNAKCQ